MKQESARLREENTRLREENARLRRVATEAKAAPQGGADAPPLPAGGPHRRGAPPSLTLAVLVLISCACFMIFIPPNLVGTRDYDMLSMASGNCDNQVMYYHLKEMTRPAPSLYQTLWVWLHYDFYYYGYPFFLTSGLSLLPVKLLARLELLDEGHVIAADMLAVKQACSLFLLLATGVLVYAWTGFASLFRSVCLFVFLTAIPLVFGFHMAWRPESLLTLFIVLAILALAKDALRFTKWFYLAAVFCGLAVGTKVTGLAFLPAVAVYLAVGMVHGCRAAAGPRRGAAQGEGPGFGTFLKRGSVFFVKYGGLFCLVMTLSFVLSNPLLLRPGIAAEYVSKARESIEWGTEGRTLAQAQAGDPGPFGGPVVFYEQALRDACGRWWMYLLATAACVFGIVCDGRKRLLNVIILAWVLPFSCYLLFFGPPDRPHYFLSLVLPLMSCLGNPGVWRFWAHPGVLPKAAAFALACATLSLGGIEFIRYAGADLEMYKEALARERGSEAIASGRELSDAYLSRVPHDGSFRILRDTNPADGIAVYVPSIESFRVLAFSGVGNYQEVEKANPDLIVLRMSNVEFFSSPDFLARYEDYPESKQLYMFGVSPVRTCYEFYRDAREDRLKDYHVVWKNHYAVAFARDKRD